MGRLPPYWRRPARLDAASEEDRSDLIDLMEAIRDAQATDNTGHLEQARTRLVDLLFYLDA